VVKIVTRSRRGEERKGEREYKKGREKTRRETRPFLNPNK
jgi:hypothetical protein|tara:strand:+ start:367 stop:486 length:120 start_codon:yes stop_codon:yes gene_type:complete